MKKFQFLNLRQSNTNYAEEIKEAVCRVIDSGKYLRSDETVLFESELANLCGTTHCVALSNGLDALRLILRAYKELGTIKDGDEIILPANSHIASVLAVTDNGLIPHFVDADPNTLNLNTSMVEEVINARTRAIMPTHLYGTPCWDPALKELANTYNLLVIEDNAQAINAKAQCTGLSETSSITGGLGNAAAHSFHPAQNLGALGDAGAVTTNDEGLANAVRTLANYGADTCGLNIYRGLNCGIDEIQAAILRIKLRHLGEETLRRKAIAETYNSHISNPLITKPTIFSNMRQVWHQYPIQIAARDDFREYMRINGIDTDIHYAVPPYKQPCYSQYADINMPVTETLAAQEVSLPIGNLTTTDAATIAQIINGFDI